MPQKPAAKAGFAQNPARSAILARTAEDVVAEADRNAHHIRFDSDSADLPFGLFVGSARNP